MDDLSHWDFAEHFNGHDAAALILGYEPRESEAVQHQVSVVYDRMKLHYGYALERFQWELLGNDVEPDNEAKRPIELVSVKMDDLHRQYWLYGHETTFSDWLYSQRSSKFENQEFSRQSIANWLTAIGMESRYSFVRSDKSNVPSALVGRWPWGDHSTQMLEHLAAAAQRYYGANYDPNDATTAPTNATVSEWLHSDRKVSKSMADAIASILRQDGLPTGPRK